MGDIHSGSSSSERERPSPRSESRGGKVFEKPSGDDSPLLRLPPDRAQLGRLARPFARINAREAVDTTPLHRPRRNVQDVVWRDRRRPVTTRGVLTLPHRGGYIRERLRRGRREFHRLFFFSSPNGGENPPRRKRSGDTQTERNALEYALSRARAGEGPTTREYRQFHNFFSVSIPVSDCCARATTIASRRTTMHLSRHTEQDLRNVNDPSAGSPTETLLRLLLPLNDQVWSAFQQRSAVSGSPTPIRRPH